MFFLSNGSEDEQVPPALSNGSEEEQVPPALSNGSEEQLLPSEARGKDKLLLTLTD